jgi:transposase
MQTQTNHVGIDISKDFFDVAIAHHVGFKHYRFSNDMTGFKKLEALLKSEPLPHVVMEASGPYYVRLASYLYEQSLKVSVVNPLVIRRYCQMKLCRTKTDKKDAQMIALYGKEQQPETWKPEAAFVTELRQLQAIIDQLTLTKTTLTNQLQAFSLTTSSKDVQKTIKSSLRHLDKQIALLTSKIEDLAQQHYAGLAKRLCSIPGVGSKTAIFLIVISGGFDRFKNVKQLSSYLGLCPRIFESGTSVKGKARITKMGMGRARALLYLCAWSAKKCNRGCKELYDRLIQKGKASRQALIAVSNKLLKQIFAIATSGSVYNPDYQKNICF